MIVKLNVWLALPTGEILQAGELAVKDPDTRGALQGQFGYLPEYLKSPRAFPLDPLHLPLTAAWTTGHPISKPSWQRQSISV